MVKKLIITLALLLFLTLGFTSQGVKINPNIGNTTAGTTWYVGGSGPGNHTTIQEAIVNASNGDIVYVYDDSSPYYEHINVYKQLEITGENSETTIIDGNGGGIIISISVPNVVIKDFTIQNGRTGIEIDGSCDNATIIGNIISDCTEKGIDVTGFNEFTIVEYNVIRNCMNASEFAASSYGKINHNSYENNDNAIVFNLWCNQNQIHFNNFINNQKDVTFYTSVLNSWLFNYWDRPHLLPKPIIGVIFFIPWINFDWRPLLKPVAI